MTVYVVAAQAVMGVALIAQPRLGPMLPFELGKVLKGEACDAEA